MGWNTRTGQWRSDATHRWGISGLAFAPNGKSLVTVAGDRTIKLWDMWVGSWAGQAGILIGHRDRIYDVAYSPDSARIATASLDRTVRIFAVGGPTNDRAFSGHVPIGAPVVATLSPGRGALIGWGEAVTWTADESLFATAPLSDETTVMALSGDGRALYSEQLGEREQRRYRLHLLDRRSGADVVLIDEETAVTAAKFSPDGTRFALARPAKNIVELWDAKLATPIELCQRHDDEVRCLDFSADGLYLASGGFDEVIHVWNVQKDSLQATLRGHRGDVWAVNFAHDDHSLLASGGEDAIVRLWDVERGTIVASLTGHGVDVYSVAFSPDGDKTLASISQDSEIRLWDPTTYELKCTLPTYKSGGSELVWSADGRTLGVKLWLSGRVWQAALDDGSP
jgi:WD40 repeat protein